MTATASNAPAGAGSEGSPRRLEKRETSRPPARGTRGAGYGEAAGAPPGARPGAPAEAAPASAAAPARFKSSPPAPKPPVPVAFPPPELREECEALLARYPQRLAALIPILHLAQKRMGGWISPELEAGVASYLGCSDQHVRGVLTFYTMFNTKPVGRHHVQVCRTLSCWLRGAAGLTQRIRERTGVSPGETGADGRFTVSEVECLGLCESAPALFVGETPHVNVTPEALDRLLDGLP